MINHQQVIALFQQLQEQHPQAFKRNILFYSLLKTKGMLDELKEIIPWLLALMIFLSSAFTLAEYFSTLWIHLNSFQYMGSAIIVIMLIMRLYLPFIMWQIHHSSNSLYAHLKNTPLKLTIVIILQAINLLYIESSVLQFVLFFFALSLGFVRLYKESMFLEKTTAEQQYYLQQIRKATLWAYKKNRKAALKMKFKTKSDNTLLQAEQKYFHHLYLELKKYEDKMCNTYKHADIESYIDTIK